MTQEPLELIPPFDGELYSEAWWQRVAPNLTLEGRALVHNTLMEAADRLEEAKAAAKQIKNADKSVLINVHLPIAVNKLLLIKEQRAKERAEFEQTLRTLQPPSEQQLAFLADPKRGFPRLKLTESGQRDLSNILICHPETGRAIVWHNCEFPAVTFEKAVFVGAANFRDATFEGEANFREVNFRGDSDFLATEFLEKAIFLNARFKGKADFVTATFEGEANFRSTVFASEAKFQAVNFLGATTFEKVTFADEANFKQAEFVDKAIFEKTTFKGVADFHAARFGKTVIFGSSEWRAVPDFVGTAFKDGMAIADLDTLQTSLTNHNLDWRNDPTPATITDRLQALRKMAHDADDRPRELDYFALELQSRYQGAGLIKWLVWLYGLFSDYGRGILRPICWLMVLWAGCALGYARLAVVWSDVSIWEYLATLLSQSSGDALTLSLVNALPALGVASEARKSSLEALYGCVECVPAVVHVIGVVEGVAAILLLFLIGLGLRNRFRL